MKKSIVAMMFLTLLIVASTTFAAAAGTPLSPGTNVPANAGFAAQGKFPQGVQTGAMGQGQSGGIAGGAVNVPTRVGLGQQQGAGIVAGDMPGTPTGNSPTGPIGGPIGGGAVGGGGPGTCECIAAPCNCPGTGGGLPQGLPNTNQPGQLVIHGQAGGGNQQDFPTTPTIPTVLGGQQSTGGIPFNPNWNTGQSGALQTAGAGQLIRR
jgi:hypothetical protein